MHRAVPLCGELPVADEKRGWAERCLCDRVVYMYHTWSHLITINHSNLTHNHGRLRYSFLHVIDYNRLA